VNAINVRKAPPNGRDDCDDAPDTTIVIGGEVAGTIPSGEDPTLTMRVFETEALTLALALRNALPACTLDLLIANLLGMTKPTERSALPVDHCAAITSACDGDHTPPVCASPTCWRRCGDCYDSGGASERYVYCELLPDHAGPHLSTDPRVGKATWPSEGSLPFPSLPSLPASTQLLADAAHRIGRGEPATLEMLVPGVIAALAEKFGVEKPRELGGVYFEPATEGLPITLNVPPPTLPSALADFDATKQAERLLELAELVRRMFKIYDRPCKPNGEWEHVDEYREVAATVRELVGAPPAAVKP
jgi:hypothetical protein